MRNVIEILIRAAAWAALIWFSYDDALATLTGLAWLGALPWPLIIIPSLYIITSFMYLQYIREKEGRLVS